VRALQAVWVFFIGLLFIPGAVAQTPAPDTRPGVAPDIRADETNLKLQRGNYVVVPIPISNPTLGTGLIAGGAYFYPQTDEQRIAQPASVTAAAAMYTTNDSRAAAIVQQNYLKENRWRFTGALGAADLRLSLPTPEGYVGPRSVDWQVEGQFLFARLARRVVRDWYAGAFTRIIDADQRIDLVDTYDPGFDTSLSVRSAGIGISLELDSRDLPLNSYSGQHLILNALFNEEAIGSDSTYQSYSASFRSYHILREGLVLAADLQACKRGRNAPLWDACTVGLRGFSVTDYLGKTSSSAQLELRWRFRKRLGLVGFGGAGYVDDSFGGLQDQEVIPSYGAGIRFMVLEEKRINMRLDYARSNDDDAIYFSVGEAF
jgi:hypothetical protein